MRVNMGREGRASSSLSANGGSMLGSLILANSPSQPLEAATKYYVDTVFTNLSANNILNGTLPISSLPAFTGDATTNQGSNSFTLANIGVTPGSYAKVIVDAKGRVTGNDILVGSDIPNFNWDKVSGDPITIDGYGITDALKISGGTLTGNLLVGAPSQSMSIVNKQYVDSALSNNSAVVGDIIRKPYASTPAGFLRCNGGLVDKIVYADLYAVIGDNFSSNTVKGNGQPWKQQYEINLIQSTDINNWSTGTALPATLAFSQAIVTKNRVYLCGGISGGTWVSTVYTAPINSDGTLGTWTTSTALPGSLGESQAIVTKNRVYLLGGNNGSTNVSTVYTAEINANGTLGSWSTANSLSSNMAATAAFISKNRAYIIGGTSVLTAPINADGTLGTWSFNSSFPISLSYSQAIVTKNRVYIIGGFNAGSSISTVYTAAINTDGTLGTWTLGIPLPNGLSSSQAFVTKNRVYLLAGANLGSSISTVYTAAINTDGTLGTWSTATPLPGVMHGSQVIVTNNRIYLCGGYNGATGPISTVYTATVYGGLNDYSDYYSDGGNNLMMPGSGQPWQNQYQFNTTQTNDLGTWTAGTSLPSSTGYSAAFVTNSYVYYIEGAQMTNVVWRAPINSDGTLGAWTTTTALPAALGSTRAIVTKNRVYLIGGYQTGGSSVSTVYTAAINADGTLGIWGTGPSLPGAIGWGSAFITKNRVYYIGGITSTNSYQSVVYTAAINADGTLSSWSVDSPFPVTIGNQITVVTNNIVYVIGGNSGTTFYNSVYSARINNEGIIGSWSLISTIPSALAASQAFVVNKRIYLLAGYVGNTALTNSTWSAPIDSTGNIGSWISGVGLPVNLGYSQLVVTSSRLYLLGGLTAVNTVNSVVYSVPIIGGLNNYSSYYDGSITLTEVPNYMMPGSGKPWQQQYQINTVQSTVLSGWTAGATLPVTNIANFQMVVTKNRIYMIGGQGDPNAVSTVYTAPINSDGTIGTWTSSTNLPAALAFSQAIVTKNRVYLLGGHNGSVATSVIYTSSINSDGTLGAWSTSGNLPGNLYDSQAVVTKNRVYLLGGRTAAATHVSTVYTAPINADGTLGTWVTSTALPVNLSMSQAVVTKNRIYILGGYNGSSVLSNIYTAPINSDGIIGSWSTAGNLPAGRYMAQAVATKNRVYLLGGYNSTESTNSVFSSVINADGTLGAWTTDTPISTAIGFTISFILANKLYLTGAAGNTTYTSISGGLNDYSSLYDGSIILNDTSDQSGLFQLPDFTHKEKNGINIFIKH